MTQTPAELFAAANAANKKLRRNLDTCTFISLTRREEDPFVVYADKLSRFEREAKEATAAWSVVAEKMTVEEIVAIVSAA